MKKILVLFIVLFGSLLFGAEEKLKVGIVYDGPSKLNSDTGKIFVEEWRKMLGSEKIVITAEKTDSWSPESIKQLIEELAKREDVDVILTAGIIGSHCAYTADTNGKVVIAPLVYEERKVSAKSNRQIISIYENYDIEKRIKEFKELTGVEKIILLISDELTPDYFAEIRDIRGIAERAGADVIKIADNGDVISEIKKLNNESGIIFGFLKDVGDEKMKEISSILNQKKIVSYALGGSYDVERGLTMGYLHSEEVGKRARKSALILQKVLENGEVESNYEVSATNRKLVLNKESISKCGIDINWRVLDNAVLVGDNERQRFTLREITDIAIRNNKEIKMADDDVHSAAFDLKETEANYLPNIKGELTGALIDKKSAESSMGMYSEKSIKGKLEATQVIYSEELNKGAVIQKKMVEVKEKLAEQKKQDKITEIAVAYYEVLKGKKYLEIQENVSKSAEQNLILAKAKAERGAASKGEEYRWEGETAIAKANVRKASAAIAKGIEYIKRVSSLEEEFDIAEEPIDSEIEAIGEKILSEGSKANLLKKLLAEAEKKSPEIQLAKQEENINKTYGEFTIREQFMPKVFLQGGIQHNVYKDDTKGGIDLSGLANLGIPVPEIEKAPDTSWSIGIGVSIDIFSGGAKKAAVEKSKIAEAKSKVQTENVSAMIKEAITSEFYILESSYYNIIKSQEAKLAVEKSYEIVNDAYQKGQISINDLINARDALVYAEQGAIVAKYDFLISKCKIERAAGIKINNTLK